jgi:pectate lyase
VHDSGDPQTPSILDAQGSLDVKVIPDAQSRSDGPIGSTTVDLGGSVDLIPSTPPAKPVFGDAPIGFASMNGGTTGGKGGNVVRPKSGAELAELLTGVTPLIIELEGTFVLDGSMTDMGSNKTVMGVGAGAKITGAGLYLFEEKNVIIRNIEFADMGEDGIGITEGTTNVWIDHCTFSNAADGLVDVVRKSNYITLSWNIFKNHVKTILIGHSDSNTGDTGFLKTTLHHNWFQKSESRHPSVRFAQVHVFNNFYDTNRSYGVASRMEADVVVENNFFLNTYFPCHVGYADSKPGDVVAINNIIRVTQPPIPSSDKNDPVPPEIPVCATRGAAFDPKSYYGYTPDLPETVPALVMLYAGANKL